MELRISQIEKHSGMEPDEMQILAVKEAVKNGLFGHHRWSGNRKDDDDQYDHSIF